MPLGQRLEVAKREGMGPRAWFTPMQKIDGQLRVQAVWNLLGQGKINNKHTY